MGELDPGLIVVVFVFAGIGAALLLVVVGLRGVVVDDTRPPGRLARAVAASRSPAVSGRIGAGIAVAVATLVVSRWPVAALGLGALVITWPRLFGGGRAEQAQISRLDALVTWTESLRDLIAAHASLERAIPASTEHAPPLIRPALIRLAGKIQVRVPLVRALEGLAVDLDDPSADLVVAALILNVERRGDKLATVLTGLAADARAELDMRRKITAGRAGLRRGVQIIVVLTIGFAVYLTVFSRDYVQPYTSAGGQVALAIVVALFAVAFAWMRRLAGGRPVQPFLARPGQQISHDDIHLVSTLTGATGADARRLTAQPFSGPAGALSAPAHPVAATGPGLDGRIGKGGPR